MFVYYKLEDQALTRVAVASKGRVAFPSDFYLEEATRVSISAFQTHFFVNTEKGPISGMNSYYPSSYIVT